MIRFIKTKDGKLVNLNKVVEVADSILEIKEEGDDLKVKWADGYEIHWPAWEEGKRSKDRLLSTLDDLKKLNQDFVGLYFYSSDMLEALIGKVLFDNEKM